MMLTHPEAVGRLRSLRGDLAEIADHLERRGACPDLLDRVHSARQELAAAQRLLVQGSVHACLERIRHAQDDAARRQALGEILELFRCAAAK
jgi:DNA-binding FrmR family transcriptional regulator